MARSVRFAEEALDALAAARSWLRQPGSGSVGDARWQALRNAPRLLVTRPYLGAPDKEQAGYRCLGVSGYRIIYRIDLDTSATETAGDIRIVAIFGPGQNRGRSQPSEHSDHGG